ncbi:MAG: hypothetical protein U9P88_00230 [Patescibacteria group bacterium]|nr:hypothetical protein [Patescibacteria group bacterium]
MINQKGLAPIIIVLIIVVFLTGGILAWQYLGVPKEKAKLPEEKISKEKEGAIPEEKIADWRTYKNEWHGFELTFPERWKGYKVKEKREGIEFSLQHSEDKEYRPVFDIMVFPKETWEQSQSKESSNISTYIAEKGNNVFSYYLRKTYGDEGYVGFPEVVADEVYQGPFFDVQTKIIPTFKIIDLGVCEYRKGDYETRVYDSQGRVTGLVNGEIKEEIPNAFYDPESRGIAIFDTENSYVYELFGIKEGNYQFEKSFIQGAEAVTFNAINIPIFPGDTHRYKFDWDALLREEEGATLLIDADGDGVFEKTINSDIKFTCQEFIAITKTEQ